MENDGKNGEIPYLRYPHFSMNSRVNRCIIDVNSG